MNTPLAQQPDERLPYPYHAPAQPMTGQAFGPLFKLLAWGMLLALGLWTLRLDVDWRSRHGAWVAVAWGMLACIAWFIQRSRIVLNAQGIEQSWMWRRRVSLRELAMLKVMRVRGLEFLIAPRIYARTLGGSFHFFYCHDRAMLEEFSRLAQALRQHEHRPQ